MSNLKIAVLVPMISELTCLKEMCSLDGKETIGPWEVRKKTWDSGITMGVIVTGTGIINASAATQNAISTWSPNIIVLLGCAGALSPEVLPGDVVIGKSIAYYSSYQTLPDGSVNLDMPAMRFRTDYSLDSQLSDHVKGRKIRERYLHSTPELVDLALKAGEKCKERLVGWPNAHEWPVEFHPPACIPGVIGTADQINSDPEVIKIICDRYGIDIEECEGAAVAQVCMTHNIPFVIIRGISDNELIYPAYGEYLRDGKGDLGWVEVESTRNAWTVFLEMIRMLGNQ